MKLREAFEMSIMLGTYVHIAFAAEFGFGTGDPSEADLETVIGERTGENTCEIEV
eukprot:COSAG04_NODE_9375_length_869_cov_1.250649_2_plen_54_part_01